MAAARVLLACDSVILALEVAAFITSLAVWSFSDDLGSYRIAIVTAQLGEILLLAYTLTPWYKREAFWPFGIWICLTFVVMLPGYIARGYYASMEQKSNPGFYLQIACAILWVPRMVSIMLARMCTPAPHEDAFPTIELLGDDSVADSSPNRPRRRGLTARQIAVLPRHICTIAVKPVDVVLDIASSETEQLSTSRDADTAAEQDSSREERHECAVCLEPYSSGDELLTLPCKHAFHASCITEWLSVHCTCPYCRLVLDIAVEESTQADEVIRPLDVAAADASLAPGVLIGSALV